MFIVAILISFLFSAYVVSAQELSEETGFESLAPLFHYPGNDPRETVTLVWDRVDNETVRGYRLHLGLSPGRYLMHENVGNVTSFTMELPRWFTWRFAITAYNGAGESPYSEELVVRYQPLIPGN